MGYYFNKYYNELFRHKGSNSLMEKLRLDLCEHIQNTMIDVDFFSEKEITDLLKDYTPDSSYLRYIYNAPAQQTTFRNKAEEIKYLTKTRKLLRDLKNTTLRLLWWNYTGYRDRLMREQEGIKGMKYVQDEIWLEEPRKRKG